MRFRDFKEMIGYWAHETPDAPAMTFEYKGERCAMDYAHLSAEVETRAGELSGQGPRCVGFLLGSSGAHLAIRLLAAVRAGLRVVLLDEDAPIDLLKEQIRICGVDSLEGDPELVDELTPFLCPVQMTERCHRLLFFTSGTTQRAKAVVLTEESLCVSAYNGGALLPLSPEDTLLCALPLNHVFGFVCGMLWGLSCGACVALGRGVRHYMDDFDFYRPTAVSLVPLQLSFLMKNHCLNPELKLVLIGAGDCPLEYLVAARQQGLRVSYGYGLTETSSGVALSVGGDVMAMDVCPDYTVTIAEDGEVLIEAPGAMMEGYYNQPEDTAAVLIDGVLHTGDLGTLDGEGRLYLTGRKKEMLVFRDGTKIFLPEYEKELRSALGPRELAVVRSEQGPVLVLTGEEKERSAVSAALAPLMAQKPRGQQLRGILFRGGSLPRTATGKVKRWELEREVEQA